MLLHFILCLFTFPSTKALGTLHIAKPGCQTHCGNITVPYPFGIGKDTGCSIDEFFYLTCNSTNETTKLFLQSSTIEVYNISDSEFRTFTGVGFRCYDQYGNISGANNWWTNLGVFTFSEKNKFTVIGCDDMALITGSEGDHYSSGCIGLCSNLSDVAAGECSGNGCCQTSITKGFHSYNVTLYTFRNHIDVWSINDCGYAFLGEEGTFRFNGASDLYDSDLRQRVQSSVHVVMDWVIGRDRNCSLATECKENSECHDADGGGYHCRCNQGYEGNPYLDQGCQDINECDDKSNCYGNCINTKGSYNCTCWPRYTGNVKTVDGCQRQPVAKGVAKDSQFPVMIFTLALVDGLLATLFGVAGIFFVVRKRKLIKLREKFFEQNGGVFLKQKLNAPGIGNAVVILISSEV